MMPGLFNLGPFEPLSIHIKCTPAQDKPVPDCLCQGVTSLLLSPSHPVQQAATSLSTFFHRQKLNFSFRNFGFNILLHLRWSHHHLLCFRTNTEKSTTGKSALSICLSWSGSGGWCSWNWCRYDSGPDDHGQDDGLDLAGRTTCRTRFSLNEWFKSNIDISLTSLRSLTLTPLSSYLHFEFLLFKCTKSWRTPLNAFHSMRRFKFAWISLTSCLPDNSSTFLQTLTKRHSYYVFSSSYFYGIPDNFTLCDILRR